MDRTSRGTLRPHRLAICRSLDGSYFVSNALYVNEDSAYKECGEMFVRIWDEGPVANLPVPEIKTGTEVKGVIQKHNERLKGLKR